MKRGGYIKRKVGLKPRTPLIGSKQPLRRTKIRIAGQSSTAELKREIQALLREIVIIRDQGCILRMERNCGGELDTPGVVLQADHLISRSNSATYAESRLVVCVCRPCHAWKSVGGNLRKAQYDELVKRILPESRVKLWEQCEHDSWRPAQKGSYDWKLAKLALEQELARLKTQ